MMPLLAKQIHLDPGNSLAAIESTSKCGVLCYEARKSTGLEPHPGSTTYWLGDFGKLPAFIMPQVHYL